MELDAKKIERKLSILADLFRLAFETKRYQIRKKHSDLSDREVSHRAYALIEKGNS